MNQKKFPEEGEKVIVRIKRVEPYGLIVELLEYGDMEGYVHISQISNSWIKNIRSFVSEGNIRVGQVLETDESKNEVNVSLRKISPVQEKKKLAEWRREKRADKLFEKLCEDIGEKYDSCYEKIAIPLKEDYNDLLTAFEEIKHNASLLKKYKFPKKWNDALVGFVEKSVTLPKVTAYLDVELSLDSPNAIDEIKKILLDATKKGVQIEYISAPKYRLIATGFDYETIENALRDAASFCVNSIEKKDGHGSIGEILK